MPTLTLKELIPQVISSWQVLAVTVVLILFIYMVNYVTRTHHRPRMSKAKPKKAKTKPKANPDELNLD